jgi:hypothetical protein
LFGLLGPGRRTARRGPWAGMCHRPENDIVHGPACAIGLRMT